MDLKHFIIKLQGELFSRLPGKEAHLMMVPPTRKVELMENYFPENGKPSAVLVLFYPHNNDFNFVLIKRAHYNGVHSGQIALPGGQFEDCDQNLETTALRETEEEIGIDQRKITIIGELSSLYIPPSNFKVYPYVGYMKNKPEFKLDGTETKGIYEISLTEFLNPAIQTTKPIKTRDGKDAVVPCFYINKQVVWGATAMIINELRMILQKIV